MRRLITRIRWALARTYTPATVRATWKDGR